MIPEELPFSPAAERNRQPLLEALDELLPLQCRVLEIASGTGQHAEYFAAARHGWHWQPSDADPDALAGIAARCAGLPNVGQPLQLDVLRPPWPPMDGPLDAVFCANMLHISPWPTCAALMQGCARELRAGGALALYGPFIVDGETTAASNLAFDASLRSRDPAWGLRRLAAVEHEALRAGISLERRIAMPANNLLLLFRT